MRSSIPPCRSRASSSARPPCWAPVSWARKLPRISPMPACRRCSSTSPRKEGDPNGIAQKAIDESEETRARAAGGERPVGRHHAGELRRAPVPACRLRPGDRGDFRAHGLEADRSTKRWRRTSVRRRSSPPIPPVFRSTRWREACPTELRPRFCGVHFFNPPRYMHLVELIGQRAHRSATDRPARDLPGHDTGQGHRACQGHAELRRQPRRGLLAPGDDGAHASASALASTSSTR